MGAMKKSGPLIIMVVFTLATLSYGGKLAEDHQQYENTAHSMDRSPASVSAVSGTENHDRQAVRQLNLKTPKTSQDPVVIAEFPPNAAPLEVEEIH
jgi:hypothetical protein